MSIDQFRASFSNFARPTQFKVEMPGLDERTVEFFCKAASLPGSTLGVIEVPYLGRKIKVPGDRTFEPWTVTIENDTSMAIRKKLEDWSNLINDHILNVGPNEISAIQQDMFVTQLGNDGGAIAKYHLVGCWPQEISAVELAFDSNDTIEEFTVTIAYDYWVRVA